MTSPNSMFLDNPVADLYQLIGSARSRGAARLLILSGKPIVCRINGKLSDPLVDGITHYSQNQRLVEALLTPEQIAALDKDGELEIELPASSAAASEPVRINVFYGDAAHNFIVFLDER